MLRIQYAIYIENSNDSRLRTDSAKMAGRRKCNGKTALVMVRVRVKVDNPELSELPTTKHFITVGERITSLGAWRDAVEIDSMLIAYTGQKL
jgi:hypothetical protein